MAKVTIFGTLSNIQMLLHTLVRGKRVGTDAAGNVYYRGRPRRGTKHERRWVVYKGAADASTVPPEWHGWLHRQTDAVPAAESRYRKPWQKPHVPNMTGTDKAWLPPGARGARPAATGDYTAWVPPQQEQQEE